MCANYIMTVRAADSTGAFGEEVAENATFIKVPQAATDFHTANILYQQVIAASRWQNADTTKWFSSLARCLRTPCLAAMGLRKPSTGIASISQTFKSV